MSVEVLFVVARDAYLYWGSAISIDLLLNRVIDKAKQMIDNTNLCSIFLPSKDPRCFAVGPKNV